MDENTQALVCGSTQACGSEFGKWEKKTTLEKNERVRVEECERWPILQGGHEKSPNRLVQN